MRPSTLRHASINIQEFGSNTVNFNSLAPVGQEVNQPVCNIWVDRYFFYFLKRYIMRDIIKCFTEVKGDNSD